MIREEIKKKIRDIVGSENAIDSNLERFAYSYDASFVPLLPAKKPDLVVRPLITEEVSKVMAEAGVRTFDLYTYCAAKGLFYPPDPASWKFSTIGGNVAENAGGMRAVKYGVTSDYVMGLEVVLADGTVLQTGGKAIKNVTGYDLVSLFTDSEGTLGIITKVLLKLIPMPQKRGTLQIMFRTLDDGCMTIHKMLQSNIVPATAENMALGLGRKNS